MMTRHPVLLLAALAVSGTLGACSHDARTQPGQSAQSARSAPTTTEPVPVFTGDAHSAFCTTLPGLDMAGAGKNPAQLKAAYERVAAARDQLTATAPSEIKPDVVVFLDGYAALAQELSKVEYDVSKLSPDRVKSMAVATDPKYVRAANRVIAYSGQVCTAPGASTTSAAS